MHSDQREAQCLLEISIAARTSDLVPTRIVGHIDAAVSARSELVRRLQEAGVVANPPSPASLSWSIQAVPIGVRLLASIHRVAPAKTIIEGLRHVCATCLVSD